MTKGYHKSQNESPPQLTGGGALASDQKLSIALSSPWQIYTSGSAVSGLVHLGTKKRDAIQEVHVSLVCEVCSIYHQSSGSTQDSDDNRREITKLLNMDETLWSRADGDTSDPPDTFPFHFTIPQFGNDAKANNPRAPLPPSFHVGSDTIDQSITVYQLGRPMGSVRYHIKVSVVRKGNFNHKERAYYPIIFLPPSPPPPLLPTLPEVISLQDLEHLNDSQWSRDIEVSNLHSGIFFSNGNATLTLWLPRVPNFPRLMRIPFIVRLILQTRRVKDNNAGGDPPKGILPPPPHLHKASLHLTRNLRTHTQGATQEYTKIYDNNVMDNFLHGITPQEGAWLPKKADMGLFYWEKGYIWRGSWIFNDSPSFSNRQLIWKYALFAEVPIKGFRNSANLVSRVLNMSSGIAARTNVIPNI